MVIRNILFALSSFRTTKQLKIRNTDNGCTIKKGSRSMRHTCITCAGLDFRMQSVGDTSLQHSAKLRNNVWYNERTQRAAADNDMYQYPECQAVKLHKNACYQGSAAAAASAFRRT
jgi:hypothetical protein